MALRAKEAVRLALEGVATGVACADCPNAELAGTVQLWEWIGDKPATTFSY